MLPEKFGCSGLRPFVSSQSICRIAVYPGFGVRVLYAAFGNFLLKLLRFLKIVEKSGEKMLK